MTWVEAGLILALLLGVILVVGSLAGMIAVFVRSLLR